MQPQPQRPAPSAPAPDIGSSDRAEQVEFFREQGFLKLDRLIDADEVARLRPIYDDIVRAHMGFTPAEMKDKVRLEERPLLVVYPSNDEIARLREGNVYEAATELVAQLVGLPPAQVIGGWRLFFKPPDYGPSKWHQDAAYRPPPHETVSVWLPIDDATPQNSCMTYLGGTHHTRKIWPHEFEDDHLIATDFDPTGAVQCPIPAGGATVHHSCTLHCSGPNQTQRPRRTLGIVCRMTKSS